MGREDVALFNRKSISKIKKILEFSYT